MWLQYALLLSLTDIDRASCVHSLTCTETDAEVPVVMKDSHRKLPCVVDGGPGKTTQINHLSAGIELVNGVRTGTTWRTRCV